MKYSFSVLAVAAAVASANASGINEAFNYTVPAFNYTVLTYNYTNSTYNYTTPTYNYTIPTYNYTIPTYNYTIPTYNYTIPTYNYTIPTYNYTVPTAIYSTTAFSANATVYPSSCIIFVSATGVPGEVISVIASNGSYPNTVTLNAASPAQTATLSAAGTRLVNYNSTASAYPTVNFTTTFNASVPISSAVYNVTSFYATVYTTAAGPSGVTTYYPNPTAIGLPPCGAGYVYENATTSVSTAALNASSTTALADESSDAIAANANLAVNGAGAVKGGLGAVLVSMAAAGMALF